MTTRGTNTKHLMPGSAANQLRPHTSHATAGAELANSGRQIRHSQGEMMKLNVIRITEQGQATLVASTESEARAKRLASAGAKKGQGQIYIEWDRASDGQQGYLNRGGHSPVGQAW